MPTLKVNDIQMYYEIHGEGKPLLLIGGLGLDLSELQSMSGWLAQRYQVIVFDNRARAAPISQMSPTPLR